MNPAHFATCRTRPAATRLPKAPKLEHGGRSVIEAEQVRKRYFGVSGKKPSRVRMAKPAEPVVRAAMKLVV